jgi:site-specific recombinase
MKTLLLEDNYSHLKSFIKTIRTFNSFDGIRFNSQFLDAWKADEEQLTKEIRNFANVMLTHAFFVNAFTEYGINSNNGFIPELIAKFKHKILPLYADEQELSHFINFLFDEQIDYLWLSKIDLSNWEMLFDTISIDNADDLKKIKIQIANALSILCNRLTTLGIDRSLSIRFPQIDDLGSPFFNLTNQIDEAICSNSNIDANDIKENSVIQIQNSIEEIENLFNTIQNDIKESGTSLNLIYLLKRSQQHIERIKLLTQIIFIKQKTTCIRFTSQLILELTQAEKLKNSIKQFFKSHTQVLAYRIVSHTSKKGESYVGFTKNENKALFNSAMGGGLIVVFLVFIKHLIHQMHLSLFFEGILFGLNYGLGFVLMHLLHYTLATKQPALTASYIAESIDNKDETNAKTSKVFKQIIQSQFISLAGNLVIVVPICFLISYAMNNYFNIQIFDNTTAQNTLFNNHLFYSLALVYAVFTGIFLTLSGMVIGYVDNKVLYSQIGLRIEKHPRLLKRYSELKRKQIANFFERNLGAIIGNLFLGFCLGIAGNMGEFIGIPFDIRHITISAGNFSIAIANIEINNLAFVVTVFITVILIGLINIVVSFLISFILACNSRGLSWKQSFKLLFKQINI